MKKAWWLKCVRPRIAVLGCFLILGLMGELTAEDTSSEITGVISVGALGPSPLGYAVEYELVMDARQSMYFQLWYSSLEEPTAYRFNRIARSLALLTGIKNYLMGKDARGLWWGYSLGVLSVEIGALHNRLLVYWRDGRTQRRLQMAF